MKILAIDTSGTRACAAVVDEYMSIGEININAQAGAQSGRKHSEILMPMIERLFAFTGLKPEQLDYIACVCGPGSFTGLRVGSAAAFGLARAAGKKLIAVPTLDALAYNAGHTHLIIVPMMDARRGQVYTSFYQYDSGRVKRISEYRALSVDEALASLPAHENYIFLGDGADAYRDIITGRLEKALFAPPGNNRQRGVSAAVCAVQMVRDGFVPSETMELMYIRKPQALREK